jgi:16S rRNA (uracil1498-N3)-methyltransferase
MTRRRWIADEVDGNRATLTGEHASHLSRVLRARVGQQFDIVTSEGLRLGRIVSVTDDRVVFDLGETISAPPVLDLTLILSIFKFDRMEWAIEKCTELGVARIVPIIARRTERHLAEAARKRVDRWRRIAAQASEQARRTAIPKIDDPVQLKDALAFPGELRILLDEGEDGTMLRDLVHPGPSGAVLAFGPEGGWSSEEVEMFQEAGWKIASLGSTILRAETAVIAATAIAVSGMQE